MRQVPGAKFQVQRNPEPGTRNPELQIMIWLIPVIPLVGSLVVGLMGRSMRRGSVALIACGAASLALLASLASFWRLLSLPPDARVLRHSLGSWIASGELSVAFGFL